MHSVSFDLSTRELSPADGIASLRHLFDTRVQLTFEAPTDRPVDARMTVHNLPGIRRAAMSSTMDVRLGRQRQMLSDGQDDICMIIGTSGKLAIEQGARQSLAQSGDAVLLVYREPAQMQFSSMNYLSIRVPFAALAPLTSGLDSAAGRCLRREMPALALLRSYVTALPTEMTDPALAGLVATHVYDLMALAIGASGETRELAAGRGVRAARLAAIKADLTNDPTLSLDDIARHQRVTPRYVQKLFEEAGTTFTGFVLDKRLDAVRAMLTSPRFREWSVTAIALEAGFGDISYFNRCFKRRFAMTPSDLRATALRLS